MIGSTRSCDHVWVKVKQFSWRHPIKGVTQWWCTRCTDMRLGERYPSE